MEDTSKTMKLPNWYICCYLPFFLRSGDNVFVSVSKMTGNGLRYVELRNYKDKLKLK